MSEQRRGFWAGLAAYTLWGVFPLYFPLLDPASATEVLAHRIVWSLLTVVGLIALRRRWSSLRAVVVDRRRRLLLVAAGVIITANWGTFIWAVTNDHVVETSLGYFINPLVLICFGVVLLGERLRPGQWIGLAVAAAAVVGLSVDYGRPPWIALVLALSFGTYGLLKKRAAVGAVEGLTVETAVVAPLALGYVGWLQATGVGTLASAGLGHLALLAGTGLVTALPLLLFGAAAPRVTLTTLGLLQYMAPVMQFAIGVLVLDEAMGAGRWVGFGLVWLALLIITAESLVHGRRVARAARRDPLADAAQSVC
ncbi:MAG: EamA family transporter RarD [Nocardioidaceae bacterium]|nr:EamA family transporter RarD [Nocardioidaceae bacterium]